MKLDLSKDFDKVKAENYLDRLIDSEAKIELKRLPEKWTPDQWGYFHVLCQIKAAEIGCTIDEFKQDVKRANLSIFVYISDKTNRKYLRSSSDLTKDELSTVISWMRTEWPELPDSTTVANNWASLQIEIENQINY